MRIFKLIIVAGAWIFLPVVHAEISFEGLYRIEKGKSHIGYAIHRAEWDEASKRRTVTFFVKTTEDGKTTTSVTRSISDENFIPLCSIAFSSEPEVKELIFAKFGVTRLEKATPDKKFTVIDSQFDKPLNIRALDEKEAKTGKALDPCDRKRFFAKPDNTEQIAENEGSFQSSFLFYIVDVPRLETGKERTYEGFSEEDGRYSYGKVKTLSNKTFDGLNVFHLDDDFAGEPIENFVLPSGDPIGARSVFNNIRTYLTTKAEAVGEFEFDQKELTPWFRGIPEGTKNPIAQANGKTSALKIVEGFEPPKADRDPNNEDIPVVDIKVPVQRGK